MTSAFRVGAAVLRTTLIPLALLGTTACLLPNLPKRYTDDVIASACVRSDVAWIDVTFSERLPGICSWSTDDAWCSAEVIDGMLIVEGAADYKQDGSYCSNTEEFQLHATCPLPTGWEGLPVELSGASATIEPCGYSGDPGYPRGDAP